MQKVYAGYFGRLYFNFGHIFRASINWRRILLPLLAFVLVFEVSAIYGQWNEVRPKNIESQPLTKTLLITKKSNGPKSTTYKTSQQVRVSGSVPAVSVVTPVQECSRNATNPMPETVSLEGQSGLKTILNAPSFYQIYGNTAEQVQAQLARCTPVISGGSEFAASTNYSMDWQLAYVDNGTSCIEKSAAVGLSISQIYPHWNDSGQATSGYAGRWQIFMNNLQTHENGHKALDLQYANKLLADLQNLPAGTCAQLNLRAKSIASADVSALNTANDNYDKRTNHGQTQGAVIPAN